MGQFEKRGREETIDNIVIHKGKAYDSLECLTIRGNETCGNITGIYYAGHLVGHGRKPPLSIPAVSLLVGLLSGGRQVGKPQ